MTPRILLAALLSTALAGQAAALSCARPSVADSFALAVDAESQYVIAVGRIGIPEGTELPEPGGTPEERTGYAVDAVFQGELASTGGFDQPVQFPITVEIGCAGAWCGAFPREPVLAFIERRGDAFFLAEGPCPRFTLNATEEVVDAALSCVTGGPCEPPEDGAPSDALDPGGVFDAPVEGVEAPVE